MPGVARLFENNRAWTELIHAEDPEFFLKLSEQQAPEYLWIGCSDSRVPANEIVGLLPGELFVHRNVANLVVHTDLNCLAVMQYAVDILKVKHLIVCGHYGCGGVYAALKSMRLGLIDNWIRHLQDVRVKHEGYLASLPDDNIRCDRLCELNVVEQVVNVCQTTVVQDAWARGQEVAVHSWIYGLADGHLSNLGMCVTAIDQLPDAYAKAIDETTRRQSPERHTHSHLQQATDPTLKKK
ncbi:carbonate dehydratase [Geomonas sp. Red32]|uniref:carbonate dehydratase n=1 Tax=Geomonas sp. Red32 TaxID=2912856 RepID=UPI00202CD348|nr:carbonate dehydratase [Geomonas sp. Red32]MCM0084353.1 carbonate dehydratase [Geomonas sp. Red32]